VCPAVSKGGVRIPVLVAGTVPEHATDVARDLVGTWQHEAMCRVGLAFLVLTSGRDVLSPVL
jgi:hypothetical protein